MFWETCSESQLLQLYNDYNITEKSLIDDIEYLLQWMKQQPHLPNAEDSALLATAIIATRNNIKKTKRLLECYYMVKAVVPHAFVNRNLPIMDIEHIMRRINVSRIGWDQKRFGMLFDRVSYPKLITILAECYALGNYFATTQLHQENDRVAASFDCLIVPLPKLTPEGFRVWMVQFFKVEDTENLPSIDTLMKWTTILFELIAKYDRHRGFIAVVNCENMIGAYIALVLSLLKTPLPRFGKLMPNILEKAYLINIPSIATPFLPLIKKIYSKSIFKRIEFWKGKSEDLAQVLPKDILPPNYGGAGPTVEELRDQLNDYIMEYKDTLTDDHVKADLTKLPQNCKLDSGFSELGYGVPGSFRNISIE